MKISASFEELRPKLEKQYENAVFSSKNCWTEAELRAAWQEHRMQNPDEERILARAWLNALLLRHAPVAEEKWNPFPGKLQYFGMLDEDLNEANSKLKDLVPGFTAANNYDVSLGVGWMIDRSHVAPDWAALSKMGLPGLIQRAKEGNSPLHKAVILVYEAL